MRIARRARRGLALWRAQVALELGRDRLAAGLGQLGGVLLLLERGDVLGDLGVLGGQLVDAALPGPGQLGQLAEVDRHVQQPPRAGTAAPASPWGTAGATRSAGPPPTASAPRIPARASGSASTPTMPVGPSYVDGAESQFASSAPGRRSMTETGTGRVCGVSASSAPSRCTRVALAERSAEAISVLNWRQRRFGSMPCTRIRSRPSGSCGDLELGGRPGDLALAVGVQLDLRAG